mmetsp:Transcript_13065/g.40248  ORF Transcript_13065/g.40248 Transcript_13065/m.40248 type:complete len:205 (-) Transcript_13065:251-865(-)
MILFPFVRNAPRHMARVSGCTATRCTGMSSFGHISMIASRMCPGRTTLGAVYSPSSMSMNRFDVAPSSIRPFSSARMVSSTSAWRMSSNLLRSRAHWVSFATGRLRGPYLTSTPTPWFNSLLSRTAIACTFGWSSRVTTATRIASHDCNFSSSICDSKLLMAADIVVSASLRKAASSSVSSACRSAESSLWARRILLESRILLR